MICNGYIITTPNNFVLKPLHYVYRIWELEIYKSMLFGDTMFLVMVTDSDFLVLIRMFSNFRRMEVELCPTTNNVISLVYFIIILLQNKRLKLGTCLWQRRQVRPQKSWRVTTFKEDLYKQRESLGEEQRELPVIVADGRNSSISVPEQTGGTESM